jgi:S-adenosylmethionine-diacylglycerol 3-amino-3-carboxypropyl transferase
MGLEVGKVLDARSLAEQQTIFDREIAPFFDSRLARFLSRVPLTAFALGIPPQQRSELSADAGGLAGTFRERVRRLACDHRVDDNYFAWQAFAGRYDTENLRALPEYLKPENFDDLRNAADRLTTAEGPITETIECSPPGSFDRFVLLDAQDWMSDNEIVRLWNAIADRGRLRSRIIFRTAGAASPAERLPAPLRSRFRCLRERSAELFRRDRSAIYGGFHLYELK